MSASTLTIALPAILDMRRARLLAGQLAEVVDSSETVSIDASDVARCSTGCIQILLAFHARRTQLRNERGGFAVIVRDPTPILIDGFRDLGLSAVLDSCGQGS